MLEFGKRKKREEVKRVAVRGFLLVVRKGCVGITRPTNVVSIVKERVKGKGENRRRGIKSD